MNQRTRARGLERVEYVVYHVTMCRNNPNFSPCSSLKDKKRNIDFPGLSSLVPKLKDFRVVKKNTNMIILHLKFFLDEEQCAHAQAQDIDKRQITHYDTIYTHKKTNKNINNFVEISG